MLKYPDEQEEDDELEEEEDEACGVEADNGAVPVDNVKPGPII